MLSHSFIYVYHVAFLLELYLRRTSLPIVRGFHLEEEHTHLQLLLHNVEEFQLRLNHLLLQEELVERVFLRFRDMFFLRLRLRLRNGNRSRGLDFRFVGNVELHVEESGIANLIGKRFIVESAAGRFLIPAVHSVSTHHGRVRWIPRMNGVGERAFGFCLQAELTARGSFVEVVRRHLVFADLYDL